MRRLALLLVLAGCSSSVVLEEEIGEEGAAQESVVEELGTFESGPTRGSGFAKIGRNRVALVGERVHELQHGQRYKLALRVEEGQIDGFGVRSLVDYRPVLRLIGTITDDAQDPTLIHLRSVNAKGYALIGTTVSSYKEVRAALPAHDYARTLFRVSAVQQRGSTLHEWLDYAPIAVYRCADTTAPAVHLDLVSVRPDDGLLDGFVETQMGNEARIGARAVCTRDGAAYACSLENVNGSWGTARFVPGAGSGGHFDLVIERTDDAHTKLTFACDTTDRTSLMSESDDR